VSEEAWEEPSEWRRPHDLRYEVVGLSLRGPEGVVKYAAIGVVLKDGRPRVHIGRLARVGPEGEDEMVSVDRLEPEAARRLQSLVNHGERP